MVTFISITVFEKFGQVEESNALDRRDRLQITNIYSCRVVVTGGRDEEEEEQANKFNVEF